MTMNITRYTYHESPVGRLLLRKDEDALSGLWITGEFHAPEIGADWQLADADFEEIRCELDAYFTGGLRSFTLPLRFIGGTAFQREVWQELTRIPYGTTIHYGALAQRIGRPAAVRAVGAANGQNPISIIVPCHRVIGANGSLTGYGGGLTAKRWLIEHEGGHGFQLEQQTPMAGIRKGHLSSPSY